MAKAIVVEAQPRSETGKGVASKLRAEGRLPGVIYGRDVTAALTVDRHDLLRLLHAHGAHPLVTVKLDGSEYLALVKELQIDAVKRQALHVDFQRVEENKPVQTEVALHMTGTPAGVKEGGVLQVQLNIVVIEALPRDLPESIDFDVSGLNIGDVARVSDIVTPEGVRIVTDAEETLVTVSAPTVAEEAAAPAAAEEAAVQGEGATAAPADAEVPEG